MLIKALLFLIFMASFSQASQILKEQYSKDQSISRPRSIHIKAPTYLDSTHKARRQAQLENIHTIVKNAALNLKNKTSTKEVKSNNQNIGVNASYGEPFKPMQVDWKHNEPVLQNPDSIFNIPDISNMPYDNSTKEPLAPPFKYTPYYGLGSYLEPSGLLPNVLPPSIAIPPMILEKVKPYQKDFIISYQFLLKNEMPSGEKFSISEPMVNRQMSVSYECKIDSVVNEDFDDDGVLDILLKLLLEYHRDEVLECLYKSGVMLREDGISEKNRSNNKTLFSLPPTYVRTSLENGFLKILVLEKH